MQQTARPRYACTLAGMRTFVKLLRLWAKDYEPDLRSPVVAEHGVALGLEMLGHALARTFGKSKSVSLCGPLRVIGGQRLQCVDPGGRHGAHGLRKASSLHCAPGGSCASSSPSCIGNCWRLSGTTPSAAVSRPFPALARETMKKHPAKRNPMAREVAAAQYRRRIKPDKRRAIEAKRMKRPVEEK
jgi:hypothetical protein